MKKDSVDFNFERAMGCEGRSKKDRRANVLAMIVGGFVLIVAFGFVALTAVQLVRVHSWYGEASELAQRVDDFFACGEYESYQKCMDRRVAVYKPEVGQKLLSEVRDMLAKGNGGYWPANEDYVWEDGIIGAQVSLRVAEEVLTKAMAKHPSLRMVKEEEDNG